MTRDTMAIQDGDVLTYDSDSPTGWKAQAPTGGGGSGDYVLLGTFTGDGSTGTASFTSISGSYRHLMVVGSGRSSAAVSNTAYTVRFNSDSGSNYDVQRINAQGSTINTESDMGKTSFFDGTQMPGTSATAGFPGGLKFTVINYSGATLYKAVEFEDDFQTGTGASGIIMHKGRGTWRSASAVTRIDIALASGNWVTGTYFSLYGLK
jgi:hypothetical protein